jgi:hypothetical protein
MEGRFAFAVHLWPCCSTGVTDICRCVAVLELCTCMAVLHYWNYWPCGKNRESAGDSKSFGIAVSQPLFLHEHAADKSCIVITVRL